MSAARSLRLLLLTGAALGACSTPQERAWTVDAPAPTIDVSAAPPSTTTRADPAAGAPVVRQGFVEVVVEGAKDDVHRVAGELSFVLDDVGAPPSVVRPSTEIPLAAGVRRRLPVDLGRRLRAFFRPRVAGPTFAPVSFDGPTAPGGVVELRLAPTGTRPVVVGRLVDDAGAPRAGASLDAQILDAIAPLRPRSGETPCAHASTDGDGRFRFAFSDAAPGGDGAVVEIVVLTAPGGSLRVRTAPTDWSRPSDLGDVRVRAPLLVAGRLVDEATSRAPTFAWIAVEWRDGDAWRDLGASVQADAEGRFEIRRSVEEGLDLRLSVNRGGYADALSFARCDDAFVGVLPRHDFATLVGAVLVPPELLDHEIRVRVAGGPGPMELFLVGRRRGRSELAEFRCATMPPGVVTVEVVVDGRARRLAQIGGVVLRAGERTSDPRLDPIVLGDVGPVRRIRVLDEDGVPLRDATVWTRTAGADAATTRWLERRPDAAGLVRAASFGDPLDVVVGAPGRRFVERRGVVGDFDARPPRAKPFVATVRLADAPPLDAGFALAAACQWLGDPDATTRLALPGDAPQNRAIESGVFGLDGVATIRLSEPGRYRVSCGLRRAHGGAATGRAVATTTTVEFVAREPLADLDVVVDVDRASVEAARRELTR